MGLSYTARMTQTETREGKATRFFARFAERLLHWRWCIVIAIAGFTVFLASQMRHLRMDNSNEAFFLEHDSTRQLQDKFKNIFGNDDFVYILIETDYVFQSETLYRVKALAQDLEARVPHLKDLKFLGNVEYVHGVEGGIEITDLIEDIPQTVQAMAHTKERAMNEPLYLDNLISRDGKTAGILLEFAGIRKTKPTRAKTVHR